MDLKFIIANRLEEIKKVRQLLHDNAELAYNEYKTSNIIKDYLNNIGLECSSFAKTGIVSTLNLNESCTAIRADMDALPINGTFHGCGHDYHMAVLLGTAAVLKDLNIEKCVKFIFQPAEEDIGGALPMINEGVLQNPKVKNMVGFHVWPGVRIGTIEVSPGASMASVDDFKITFEGRGGHAAIPQQCINPLHPAMDYIRSLENISRYKHDPEEPHVLTVTSLNCGTSPNVIADQAVVMGTLRTFNEKIRLSLKDEIIKTAELTASNFKCKAVVHYDDQYPPLINDPSYTNKFIKETSKIIGKENILPLHPTFAGEDFAFFAKAVPSVHFRLGITGQGVGEFPLHSHNFNVHEDALFYGIYILTNFIISS